MKIAVYTSIIAVALGAFTSCSNAFPDNGFSDLLVLEALKGDSSSPGITVNASSSLFTSETGATASFEIVLNTLPTDDVTIPVSSGNSAEGTISSPFVGTSGDLTFTPDNWSVPQVVIISGVDDAVPDGNVSYTILIDASTSADANYDGIDPTDPSVVNIDDESASGTPGIQVIPFSGLVTTEGWGTAVFGLVLTAQPIADVTVGISSSNTGEGTVSSASLTFTSANWDIPQTITVTGVDDAAVDGNVGYSVITAPAVSTDPGYSGIDPADVTATNYDDETASIQVSAGSGLIVSEGGATHSFTLVLTSQPSGDVTIPVSVDNAAEATITSPFAGSSGNVIISSASWNTPVSVTVQGLDDAIADGNVAFNIVTGAATSSDANYAGLNPVDVTATNLDDDSAGVTLLAGSSELVSESGGSSSFTVVLNTQPTANVSLGVSISDGTEGSLIAPASGNLTFTSGNWNVAQTVTVQGVDDAIADGNQPFNVVLSSTSSGDAVYNGTFNPPDVSFINVDDDAAGITVNAGSGARTVTESGSSYSFQIVLNSEPTANVSIPISVSDTTEGFITAPFVGTSGNVTFTSGNWNIAQTVTVQGQDDIDVDGTVSFDTVIGISASGDPAYGGIFDPADINFNNIDDETPGITVDVGDGLVVSESGTMDSFSVVLNEKPLSSIIISTIASADTGEVTVSPSSLTFTTVNWGTPQTVTVTGADDAVTDGKQSVIIDLGTVTTGDGEGYPAGMDPGDVTVHNLDNEALGVVIINPSGTTTNEAGLSMTFQVVLASQPAATVNIPSITTSDNTEGIPSPTSLTFTTTDWNIPQTITVTGQPDDGDAVDIAYSILLNSVSSADPVWNGLNGGQIDLVNKNYTPGEGFYTYTASTTVAAYNSISGTGTDITAGFTSLDDGYNDPVALPFTFVYTGNNYNDVTVSSNGYACFDPDPTHCGSLGNTAFIDPTIGSNPLNVIAPWWDDNIIQNAAAVYSQTQGTAPNRVFVIEWFELESYDLSAQNNIYNFQIRFYETSNVIEFHYGSAVDNGDTGISASLGINDLGTGDCHYIDGLNGGTGTTCNGVAGSETYLFSDFPASGTVIRFTP